MSSGAGEPAAAWYSVLVEARAPRGGPTIPGPEDRDDISDALMDGVAAHDGSVGVGEQVWTVRLSVEARDAPAAATEGARLACTAAVRAGAPDWPIVRLEAVTEDVLDEDNARPQR